MVSQKFFKKVEIASYTIPHTFLMGEFSQNCLLGSDFLIKMAAEVDFEAKKLLLCQRDKTGTTPA